MKPVVVAAYVRSPFTLATKGELARVRPNTIRLTPSSSAASRIRIEIFCIFS